MLLIDKIASGVSLYCEQKFRGIVLVREMLGILGIPFYCILRDAKMVFEIVRF